MPAVDAVQLVRAAVERNRGIPTVLDAYGEFVDCPIGTLELENLSDVFARILDNLSQRFPDTASKRAANTAYHDVMAFLVAANNNVDRVKEIMKAELLSVKDIMSKSIAERFRRMNNEERQAIDATLRIVRRSKVELLFKANFGKQLASSDKEYQRYFALIKSQASELRELRYENLIVEKAIFNRLMLKSKNQDYFIWVPSFFAKASVDELIARNGISSDHLLLSELKELETQGKLTSLEPFLKGLDETLGIVSEAEKVPNELVAFVQKMGEYTVLPPIELDDIFAYFEERKSKQEESVRQEEERIRLETEVLRLEQEKKSQQLKQKIPPPTVPVARAEPKLAEIRGNSVYLGKQLNLEQFVSAISRRVSEGDMPLQVKQIGDYYLEFGKIDVAIVGSSGSGKSITLKRILDGIAAKPDSPRFIVVDPKGEHRGIAWKYKWRVFAFAKDPQAEELKIPLILYGEEAESAFTADLIHEWFNQSGFACSDEQKERISSVIRAHMNSKPSFAAISDLLVNERELLHLGQKLKKNLVQKSSFSRLFSESSTVASMPEKENILFDISGRGLKDPTTKEDRQMLSVLLLRDLDAKRIKNSIIVLEDVLDRFKVERLKSKTIAMIQRLRANGNRLIVTSRSQIREFLGENHIELVHRLSGEKGITEEFSAFDTDVSVQSLMRIVAFLPRGYLITSRTKLDSLSRTAIVEVDPLQFVSSAV